MSITITSNDNFRIDLEENFSKNPLHRLLSIQNAKQILKQFNFDIEMFANQIKIENGNIIKVPTMPLMGERALSLIT